jgi:2-methylisocitrate lyase-like PEP mutase family enzyme
MNQQQHAEAFRRLHVRGNPLVLYNAWDAGTARAVVAGGAAAVATGSWSVAAAHGWDDGEQVPLEFVLANATRIAGAIDVPLTVDLESGYGSTPDEVGATVAATLAAGAVGANLEDSEPGSATLRTPQQQSARYAAARRAAEASGVPFFVNARTDVFLVTPAERHADVIDDVLDRARRYADAGADGLFVPGLADARSIARVVTGSPLPVNVMVVPTLPPVLRLAELGVARVSHGPGPYRELMAALTAAARRAIHGAASDAA